MSRFISIATGTFPQALHKLPLGMFKSVALLKEQYFFFFFLQGRALHGPLGEGELPEPSRRLFNEKKTMLFSGILPRIYKQAG